MIAACSASQKMNPPKKRACSLPSVVAACALLLAASGAGIAARGDDPPPGGRIAGTVHRAGDGRPLAKAVVVLTSDNGDVSNVFATTRTDAGGNFEFKDVAAGRYHLRAQRNGYVTQLYGQRSGGPGKSISLPAGGNVGSLDFQMMPAGVITGNIGDEDGEGIENIFVTAMRVTFQPGGKEATSIARTTRTDDLGNYRLANLAPGFYYVEAGAGRGFVGQGPGVFIAGRGGRFGGDAFGGVRYAPAYFPGTPTVDNAQRVQVNSGAETNGIDLDVTPAQVYTVSGVVLDSSAGGPVQNYSVGIVRNGGMALDSSEDGDGKFSIRGLTPGDYTLEAVIEDGGRQRRAYQAVHVGGDMQVTMEAGQTGEVDGQIQFGGTDNQNLAANAFAGLRIALRSSIEGASVNAAAVDPSGRFSVRGLTAGQYTFQLLGRQQEMYLSGVKCQGQDYTAKAIPMAAGQVVADCEVSVQRDVAAVSGTVALDDKMSPEMMVVLIPTTPDLRRDPRRTIVARLDTSGKFLFRGVIPDNYFAFVVLPSDDDDYYALDFPERNAGRGERVTIVPSGQVVLALKPPSSSGGASGQLE